MFEITEADGNGDVRVTITITASASPITVLPGALPALRAGTPVSQAVMASGGLAPYTFTLQSGVLPPGLTLSSGGVLSGFPTERGGYSFSVRARDATSPAAQFVDKGYTGAVQNPSLALAQNTGTASPGVPFFRTLVTNGGVAPSSYMLETGPLSVVRGYALNIGAPTVTLTPAAGQLPGATVGVAYSETLSANGGVAPYSFAVTAGALPAGLSLASSGSLTATPTASGVFTFTIAATDAATAGSGGPYAGSSAYTLSVGDAVPVAAATSVTVAYGAGATPVPPILSNGSRGATLRLLLAKQFYGVGEPGRGRIRPHPGTLLIGDWTLGRRECSVGRSRARHRFIASGDAPIHREEPE